MSSLHTGRNLSNVTYPIVKLIPRAWAMGMSLLLALVLSAGLLGLNPVTASAATLSAHHVTLNQQTLHDQAAIQQQVTNLLKSEPGSKQIAWNAVSLAGGQGVMRFMTHANLAAPMAYYGCSSGQWCVFSKTYFGGSSLTSSDTSCGDVWSTNVFVGVWSYSNYTSAVLYVYTDPNGPYGGAYSFDILSGHSSNNTGGNPTAWDTDQILVC